MRNTRFLFVCAALAAFTGCGTEEPEEEAAIIVSFDDPQPAAQDSTPVASNNMSTVDPTPTNSGPDNSTTVVEPSAEPNEGWIGGACTAASECDYDDATCLSTGHPGGMCSMTCAGLCPDQDGENSETFCINGGSQGRCVSKCDTGLYDYNGCREGYTCQVRTRFDDVNMTAAVCVPDGTPPEVIPEPEPEPEIPCLDQLNQLGVNYRTWGYTTEYADGLACTIDDPIYVSSPINGINYRYYSESSPGEIAMSCDLALAVYKFGDVLKDWNIVEVEHKGTFNCRKIGGTDYLSMHGYGLAIDFSGFLDSNGTDYVLVRDWEHDTNNPTTTKGQMLYDLALRMYNDRVFNYILTPNFNDAHDDHFHVDLTPGDPLIAQFVSPYQSAHDCGNE